MFDSDGNVLHYALKLATPERLRRLHEYLRYLAASGAFENGITLREVGGRTRLLRNPAKRHGRRSR